MLFGRVVVGERRVSAVLSVVCLSTRGRGEVGHVEVERPPVRLAVGCQVTAIPAGFGLATVSRRVGMDILLGDWRRIWATAGSVDKGYSLSQSRPRLTD